MSPLININFVKKELHNKGVIKFNNELKLQQAVNTRPSPRLIQKQRGNIGITFAMSGAIDSTLQAVFAIAHH